jgi:hypothetical protein
MRRTLVCLTLLVGCALLHHGRTDLLGQRLLTRRRLV